MICSLLWRRLWFPKCENTIVNPRTDGWEKGHMVLPWVRFAFPPSPIVQINANVNQGMHRAPSSELIFSQPTEQLHYMRKVTTPAHEFVLYSRQCSEHQGIRGSTWLIILSTFLKWLHSFKKQNVLWWELLFLLGMVLIPVSCTMSWTSVHSSSGTLSIRSSPLNLFLTSTI